MSQKQEEETNFLNDLTKVVESTEENIRVVCRFRPTNSKEKHEEKQQQLDDLPITTNPPRYSRVIVPRAINENKPPLEFDLDQVIWTDAGQSKVFEYLAKPLVDQVILGYNCTLFAFGQTGSGKTYTMFGPDNYRGAIVESLGIIPRSVYYLYEKLAKCNDALKFSVTISVVEVYKEMLRDLLDINNEQKRLEIYSSMGEVTVKNLTDKPCTSVDDVLSWIVQAQDNRRVTQTQFIGHHSSRSHCVVMINVTQRMLDDTIKTSKLNFGDLAGSELAKRTGAEGATLEEAGKIHQGLLVLERVITALVEKRPHIPYKDSKLTRLLCDSLGGNSKTTIVVCCSPHIWNRSETISTLRFAQRAKTITNKATINKKRTREQLEKRVQQLEELVSDLRRKLKTKTTGGNSNVSSSGQESVIVKEVVNEEQIKKIQQLTEEQEALKVLLDKKNEQIQQFEDDIKAKMELIEELSKSREDNKKYQTTLLDKNEQVERLRKELELANERLRVQTQQLSTQEMFEKSFASHNRDMSSVLEDQLKDKTQVMVTALQQVQAQQGQMFTFLQNLSTQLQNMSSVQKDYGGELELIHACMNKQNENTMSLFQDLSQKIASQQSFVTAALANSVNGSNQSEVKLVPKTPSDEFKSSPNLLTLSKKPEISSSLTPVVVGKHVEQNNPGLTITPIELPRPIRRDNEEDRWSDNEFPLFPSEKKTVNDIKAYLGSKPTPGADDVKEVKDVKGVKDVKEVKDIKEVKEIKQVKGKVENPKKNENDDFFETLDQETEMIFEKPENNNSVVKPSPPVFTVANEPKSFQDTPNPLGNSDISTLKVGLRIDALDRSYEYWYTAQIMGMDPGRVQVLVKYDGFDERWNDWITFSEQYRIAPYLSRCQKPKDNATTKSGTHVLAATKYSKTDQGKLLRAKIADGSFDFSEVDILMAGYIHKKGNWNTNWNRRYFTLRNDNCLYYSDNAHSSFIYKGVIPLNSIRRLAMTADAKFEHGFALETKQRIYYLACVSSQDRTDWMSTIACMMTSPLQVEQSISRSVQDGRSQDKNNQTTTKSTPGARFSIQGATTNTNPEVNERPKRHSIDMSTLSTMNANNNNTNGHQRQTSATLSKSSRQKSFFGGLLGMHEEQK